MLSDCESSTGSWSSAAEHPSPLISTRGRELSLHLRQQRLQLLRGFNYITAAKAAKAANHMVCNTVSSTWNSESVVVLYRGGPIYSPASSLAIHNQQLAHEDADFMLLSWCTSIHCKDQAMQARWSIDLMTTTSTQESLKKKFTTWRSSFLHLDMNMTLPSIGF